MPIATMSLHDFKSTRPAVTNAEACAPLDAAALQRLRELDPGGGNRVVERVMRAFESSLTRLLSQASSAQIDGDKSTIAHVAHTLKSSSASVGALELSRRCSEIENRLRVGQDDDLDGLLLGMRDEGRRVLRTVQSLLGA